MTSSGKTYTISRLSQDALAKLGGDAGIRVSSNLTCLEVQANGMAGGGCLAAPEPGQSIAPTQATLGDDMIVPVLADASVDAVEIQRTDGRAGSVTARTPVDLDSLRLYHAVLHTPADALATGKDGLPSPPVLEIRAIDSEGKIVDSQTLNPSGPEGTN